MAADAIGTPVRIRFDGLDADHGEIEIAAFSDSLKGLGRIAGVCGNFAATLKYVQHRDAMDVKVVVRPPSEGSFEIWAAVEWVSQNPLIATTVGGLFVTLITYVFRRAAGQREEMKHLRGALDEAIRVLGVRDQSVIDRLLQTIDKMADSLRPAARQAVTPIGETARTLSVHGVSSGGGFTLGKAEKDAINTDAEIEVTEESTYHIFISEIDTENGSCKIRLVHEPERRFDGKITDPAFSAPNNKYVLALASKSEIVVRAKSTLKDGEMQTLYISDTA